MARKKVEQTLLTVDPVQNMYEMIVVFKPFLPDKVRNEADEKVSKIIEETKGKVLSIDIWGKRYLAYKIQGHVEGYYVMYQFKTEGKGIEYIKKYLNRHQEIIRYLIIKKDENEEMSPKIKMKQSINSPKEEVVVA